MKTLLLILLSFSLSGQNMSKSQKDWERFSTNHNDVVHFYAALTVDAAAYHIQSYAFPKWKPAKKILVSNLITLGAIFGKELWDKYKANPTGFNFEGDAVPGIWSIGIYDIFNVCKRDYVGHDVGDAYVKRIEVLDSLNPAPRKWSLKRMGFLN